MCGRGGPRRPVVFLTIFDEQRASPRFDCLGGTAGARDGV
jgi:hypothetical protein